jgi:hypothetical protein
LSSTLINIAELGTGLVTPSRWCIPDG